MGGFGTGFGNFFQVTDAVDFWKDACETYSRNHQLTKVHNQTVENFTQDCIPKDYEGILYTGIVGGPPCQEFSTLNQSPNLHSKRASQVLVFTDIVKQLQPKFAMIENVATIPKILKERSIKDLEMAGYKVVSRVIKAHDYGSVQKRRRWILTASKYNHIFPVEKKGTRTANEILMPGTTSEMKMSKKIEISLKNLPRGRWVALPGKKWKEYYIVDPNKPLPAIVNVMKNRIVKPDCSGYLSFEELLQGQGFSSNYFMAGTKSSKAQQLANAIPVELAQSFAQEFFKRLHPDRSKLDFFYKQS